MVLSQFKQERTQLIKDTDAIHQSMELFVNNLEKENDELYHKLVNFIKNKESKMDERIQILEENLDREFMSTPIIEPTTDNQDDENQTSSINSNSNEQENGKIRQLYKQGFSSKQIAKVLKLDHGEVEIIINMYINKQRYHK